MKFIERKLDGLTMYRVVLYGLSFISFVALLLSIAGILWTPPEALLLSLAVGHASAILMHMICVRLFRAPGNIESSFITAGILFLILTPVSSVSGLLVTAAINAAAILLKYVVRYRRRHLFNPVALALFVAAFFNYYGAEWWVGSRYLLPAVLVVGLLVVMKTRRWPLFLFYIVVSSITAVIAFLGVVPAMDTLVRHFISWPTVFFAAFMLTEPLALPSTKKLQYVYAGIAGVLSAFPFSIGVVHGTPELALLVANLFTFVVERPVRFRLSLIEKREVGKQTVEYTFATSSPVRFTAGQYLEWTLPHAKPDTRGIRRYLTIVSAPPALEQDENRISFAVRHVEKQSTWKAALAALPIGGTLYATQRAGDFTLRSKAPHYAPLGHFLFSNPFAKENKVVLIAGGIGITPFMSMMRDARAKGVQIPATLFYCNKTRDDIAFLDEISAAREQGVQTVHVLEAPQDDSLVHETGFITEDMLKRHVSPWKDATYYISGPPGLVNAYKKLLRRMGISRRRIVTDYFPGLA